MSSGNSPENPYFKFRWKFPTLLEILLVVGIILSALTGLVVLFAYLCFSEGWATIRRPFRSIVGGARVLTQNLGYDKSIKDIVG